MASFNARSSTLSKPVLASKPSTDASSRTADSSDPRAAARAPGKKDGLESQLNQLATTIQKFRVDVQRFLAGDLHLPPDELRAEILANFRQLRSAALKGVAENFRLNSLEAQFNSYSEQFGRRLREVETAAHARKESARHLDPGRGVVIDARLDPAAVNALYQGLYLQPEARNPSVDLERFRTMIERQAAEIRHKTGCQEISFRVVTEEGKLKLKAKPVR